MHESKRKEFMRKMKGGVAIFPSALPALRTHDVEYEYRQDSNFYYLTGFEEPVSICVLAPDHPEHQFVLFVNPHDPEQEAWTGKRVGVEGGKALIGADEAYPITEFDQKIHEYLKDANQIYYRFGSDEVFNRKIVELCKRYGRHRAQQGTGPNTLIDPGEILGEMRLIKSGEELKRIRRATEITADAQITAMKTLHPGQYEYEIQAMIDSIFRTSEGSKPGFPTIVASAANAATLHYTANNRQIQDGDLVLIDAGCEYKYYSGDITRTYPANGRFTSVQREIYQLVLECQLAAIEAIRPGVPLDEPNKKSVALMTEGMLKIGLLAGEKEELIAEEKHKQFCRHGIGHMLGLDVHDLTKTREGGTHKTFQPGMVFTVEPGLYIAADTENVNPKYIGIGVRIEDDVLVTASGCEVLTSKVPKSIDEIERLMGESKQRESI